MKNTNNKSLYERLGSANGISKLVDDIVNAHMENPSIQARFIPLKDDPEKLERIKKHTRQFLGAGSGGPEIYEGQVMPAAHRGMNVSEAEYMHTIDDIMASLDKNNIDQQSKNEVLAIAYSLKEQIVRL
ncbi:MAG: group 1 truncated hemoglobin [Bacteroidales bacterium]|jgi:hemoglobin|nr:group 1 truncated hemoglobin [Bacteroidales bacterium]